MKKFFVALVITMMMAVPAANACTGYGCWEPAPLQGSSEAQAFQNMDLAYSQDAGVQNISQVTTTKTEKESIAVNADVYGSFHGSPDVLVFGKGGIELVKTNTDSFSVSTVCATVNAMNGSITMGADAGASTAATGSGAASSIAGNSGGTLQAQVLAYPQGGGGLQIAAVQGYTNVTAFSGKQQ